jgi:hypothetical protein
MTLDDQAVLFLKDLPRLRELSLDATSITDHGAQTLRSMTELRALNIYHTLVTENAWHALKTALPECQIVFDRDSALPNRRIRQ